MLSTEIPINKVFKPTLNLTIFETTDDGYGNHFYIESRVVRTDGSLGAAVPLKQNTLRNLALSLSSVKGPKITLEGMIPKEVLSINQFPGFEQLTWLSKPRRRKLYFKNLIDLSDDVYPIPPLIFIYSQNKSFRVYAVKTTNVNEETELYRAPFPNVSSSSVCMGRADYKMDKQMSVDDLMETMEDRFFNSYFSHTIGNDVVVKGNFVLLYKEIQKDDKFPLNKLQPHKKELREIL